MTRDIPIIFSGPMVRALLERRKRMTRRLAWREGWYCGCDRKPLIGKKFNPSGMRICPKCGASGGLIFKRGASLWQNVKPGDRLYVRESFREDCPDDPTGAIYLATEADRMPKGGKWKPSIHMPRIYSRITLVVTAVKIDPLWKISEADAEAEGCVAGKLDDGFGPRDFGGGFTIESSGTWASAAGMFQILWNSLHGEDAWEQAIEADTEVVALSFDVHLRNIDQMEKAA